MFRIDWRAGASSLTHSAMMSRAPCRASSVVGTSLFKNWAAFCSTGPGCCLIIHFASSSRPLLRAFSARVSLLGL